MVWMEDSTSTVKVSQASVAAANAFSGFGF